MFAACCPMRADRYALGAARGRAELVHPGQVRKGDAEYEEPHDLLAPTPPQRKASTMAPRPASPGMIRRQRYADRRVSMFALSRLRRTVFAGIV
jgi:hypothetical protein